MMKILEVNEFKTPKTLKRGSICCVININRFDAKDYFVFKVMITRALKTVVYACFPDDDTNECFKFKKRKTYPLPEFYLGGTEFYDEYLVDNPEKYKPFEKKLLKWRVI